MVSLAILCLAASIDLSGAPAPTVNPQSIDLSGAPDAPPVPKPEPPKPEHRPESRMTRVQPVVAPPQPERVPHAEIEDKPVTRHAAKPDVQPTGWIHPEAKPAPAKPRKVYDLIDDDGKHWYSEDFDSLYDYVIRRNAALRTDRARSVAARPESQKTRVVVPASQPQPTTYYYPAQPVVTGGYGGSLGGVSSCGPGGCGNGGGLFGGLFR